MEFIESILGRGPESVPMLVAVVAFLPCEIPRQVSNGLAVRMAVLYLTNQASEGERSERK